MCRPLWVHWQLNLVTGMGHCNSPSQSASGAIKSVRGVLDREQREERWRELVRVAGQGIREGGGGERQKGRKEASKGREAGRQADEPAEEVVVEGRQSRLDPNGPRGGSQWHVKGNKKQTFRVSGPWL